MGTKVPRWIIIAGRVKNLTDRSATPHESFVNACCRTLLGGCRLRWALYRHVRSFRHKRGPTMREVLASFGLRSTPHPRGYPYWRIIWQGEQCFGKISTPHLWERWRAKEPPFDSPSPLGLREATDNG